MHFEAPPYPSNTPLHLFQTPEVSNDEEILPASPDQQIFGKQADILDSVTPGINIALHFASKASAEHFEASGEADEVDCSAKLKRKSRFGSSTIAKNKRKKRAAIKLEDDDSNLRIKTTNDMETSYIKYVRLENIQQNDNEESPIFVSISGFKCSYENFRLSLMPRGFVLNDLMAVFVQVFNNEHKNISESRYDRNKVAFTPFLVEKLMMDQKTYIPESTEPEVTRINEEMDISNADLLLFPLILNDHWVLICVNFLSKEVQFLDPTIRNSESVLPMNSIKYVADNVVFNFQRTCQVAQIFDRDLQNYPLKVPKCPKHTNTYFQKNDCGIFVMLFMKYWNGAFIKKFDHNEASKYRKLSAFNLMHSKLNESEMKSSPAEDEDN